MIRSFVFSTLVFLYTFSTLCMETLEKKLLLVVKEMDHGSEIRCSDPQVFISENNSGTSNMYLGKEKQEKPVLRFITNNRKLALSDINKNQEFWVVPTNKSCFTKTDSEEKKEKLINKFFTSEESVSLNKISVKNPLVDKQGKITLKGNIEDDMTFELKTSQQTLDFIKKHFSAFSLILYSHFNFPFLYFKQALPKSKSLSKFFKGKFTLKTKKENEQPKQVNVALQVLYEM